MRLHRAWKGVALASGATLAAGALFVACGGSDGDTSAQHVVNTGTVINNVTVVDTRTGAKTPGQSVVIESGRITFIDATANVRVGTATAIDGTGKYIVPGYNDMHTHAMGVVDSTPTYWPQMIANGITGFREMGGSAAIITRGRKLNADNAAGTVLSPELLAIPSSIIATTNATTATNMVKQAKLDGADFIKTTTQSQASFAAMMAEAKNQGLLVSGHLYGTTSAVDASNAGWRAMEHIGPVLGLAIDCSSDETKLRTDYRAFTPLSILTVSPFLTRAPEQPFIQRAIDTYDPVKCASVADVFVKNQTWQSLTMIRVHTMEHSADAIYRNDPNLIYVEPARVAMWQSLADQYLATIPTATDTTFRNFWDVQVKIVGVMRARGVPALAGSDLGGIWVVPGFSLQQEFKLLASAGYSPLEVLQMTTLRPAQFLNRTDMGTVEVGKNADLVLLDADPTADVANLGKIDSVFVKGRYQSKATLAQMLADAAAAYRRLSATEIREDPNDTE